VRHGANISKYYDLTNLSSFITDLDPSTIEVLVTTVSRTQAPALRDLLYKHLMRKASIGVTIPVSNSGSNIHNASPSLMLIIIY
jgi:hypothetical protein